MFNLLFRRALATAAAPVRNTLKVADSRKTYLMDVYTQMWRGNSIVLLAHHNNLVSTENEAIRKQLHAVSPDVQFRKLKGSLFKHFLRASKHEDPASKAAYRMVKRNKIRHPLEFLLKGPTAAILIPDLDPKKVKDVAKVLKSQKEKLFILGGKVGEDCFDLTQVLEFSELKSLPELRSELLGLLAMASGAGITRTLEAASQSLAMTLESRKNELEKGEEGEKKED